MKRRAGYNTVHPERIVPEWPFAVGWAQGNGTAYHYTQGDDLGWPTGDSATLPSPTAATAGSPTFNDGPQGCFASVTGPSYETLCGDFSVCTEKGIGCWQQIYSAYRGYGADMARLQEGFDIVVPNVGIEGCPISLYPRGYTSVGIYGLDSHESAGSSMQGGGYSSYRAFACGNSCAILQKDG